MEAQNKMGSIEQISFFEFFVSSCSIKSTINSSDGGLLAVYYLRDTGNFGEYPMAKWI